MKPRDILLALIVAFIWGVNFVMGKLGTNHFPPIFLMAFRFALVALILLPFVPKPNISKKKIFLISLTQIIGYHGLIFTAVWKGIDISTSVITTQLNVPLTSLLSIWVFNDKIGWRRALGMIIALTGILIIVGTPDVINNKFGFTLVLLSVVFWSVFNIQIKKLGDVNILSLMAWSSLFSIAPLLLLSYLLEPISIAMCTKIPNTAIYSIVYMAVVSTIIGFGIWFYLLGKYPVNQVAPFSLVVPIFGIIAANIVLKETLTWQIILGGIITLIGVGIIVIRRPQMIVEGKALS